jgi:hypothetical protein
LPTSASIANCCNHQLVGSPSLGQASSTTLLKKLITPRPDVVKAPCKASPWMQARCRGYACFNAKNSAHALAPYFVRALCKHQQDAASIAASRRVFLVADPPLQSARRTTLTSVLWRVMHRQ